MSWNALSSWHEAIATSWQCWSTANDAEHGHLHYPRHYSSSARRKQDKPQRLQFDLACPCADLGDCWFEPASAHTYWPTYSSWCSVSNLVLGIFCRYGDDPTIMAWDLINEPRCYQCGTRLQVSCAPLICNACIWHDTVAQVYKKKKKEKTTPLGVL